MDTEDPFGLVIVVPESSCNSAETPSSSSIVNSSGYQRVPSVKLTETTGAENQSDTGNGRLHRTNDASNSSIEGLAISSVNFASRRPISKAPSESEFFESSTNPVESQPAASVRQVGDGGLHNIYQPYPSPSFVSSIHEPYETALDTERLYPTTPISITSSHGLQQSGSTSFNCKSRRDIIHKRWHWLSVTILILAIYSTTFSGIWLVVAALKPRYGGSINTTTGKLSPINASTLTAAFAKTIELSFVTVFVAFIGQVLSRRAFMARSKGITIAEMSTRHWVTQPGMMFTNWDSVRHAGNTPLGILCLVAVIVAVLYTTASDTLGKSVIFPHDCSLYCVLETDVCRSSASTWPFWHQFNAFAPDKLISI